MTTTKTTPFTISKQTLGILKNFSSMNSNILVKQGNVIKTITPSKNGMAEATVPEDFPQDFGIWDLNKFLGVISMFSTPTFAFGDKSVKISNSGDSTVHYYYSEPRLLTVPTKSVNMPKIDQTFTLTSDLFSELQKASAVMQLPDLSIQSDGSRVSAVICDVADPTSNTFRTVLSESNNSTKFRLNFKIDNLHVLQGDYTVSFSKNVVGMFTNTKIPLTYWFALETTSTYED